MKKNVWNFDIHPFFKSCARHNAKPFAFFIFGFSSLFWIFWCITHDGSLLMTSVTHVIHGFDIFLFYFPVFWMENIHWELTIFMLHIFTFFYHFIWYILVQKWACRIVFSVQSSQPACHVMCKVAYPKFATVYKPSWLLLELLSHPPHSHLPPSQMQLLTWFFLLWPLAIIYYHLGILNSFMLHLGYYKSPQTAIFFCHTV